MKKRERKIGQNVKKVKKGQYGSKTFQTPVNCVSTRSKHQVNALVKRSQKWVWVGCTHEARARIRPRT